MDELPDFHVRDELYQQFARIGRALSNRTRLRLVSQLAQSEKSVERLAERIGEPVANVSIHLKGLADAHLVATRREGRYIHYRLAGPDVTRLWLVLREVAVAHLPEVRETVRRYYDDPETLAELDEEELAARARRGDVLLVDLRPPDEFAEGHIPGARSVPYTELERRLAELPRDRRIVAYCRGPYCVMTVRAVHHMRREGLDVRRLPLGVGEWHVAGRHLETGPSDERPPTRGEPR